MVTKIAGSNEQGLDHKKASVILLDGSVAVSVAEPDNIVVYHSFDRVVWTRKVEVQITGVPNRDFSTAMDVYPDGSIGLFVLMDEYIRYAEIITSGPTWTETNSSFNVERANGEKIWSNSFDATISETGAVHVAFIVSNINNDYSHITESSYSSTVSRRGAWLRVANRSVAGVWSLSSTDIQLTIPYSSSGSTTEGAITYAQMLSIGLSHQGGLGSSQNSARPIVVALGTGRNYGENGIKVYTAKISDNSADLQEFTYRKIIGELDFTTATSPYRYVKRFGKIVWEGADEFTVVVGRQLPTVKVWAAPISWDGTTYSERVSTQSFDHDIQPYSATGHYQCSVGFGYSSLGIFHFIWQEKYLNDARMETFDCFNISFSSSSFMWSQVNRWTTEVLRSDSRYFEVFSPLGRTSLLSDNYDVFIPYRGAYATIHPEGLYYQGKVPLPAPVNASPSAGGSVLTSEPAIYADLDFDTKYSQVSSKIRFRFAKDISFSTGVRDYTQADSQLKSVNGTDVPGFFVRFNEILPFSKALTQNDWYGRVSVIDSLGKESPYYEFGPFTVTHPPTSTGVTPGANQTFVFTGGPVGFDWSFSDTWPNDSQSAYQVTCSVDSTSELVFDSGKVSSNNTIHYFSIPASRKDVTLRWRVQVWDLDDRTGSFSSYLYFRLSDAPLVSIQYPTDGTAVNSSSPYLEFTPTLAAGKFLTSYRVVITEDGSPFYNSGAVSTSPVYTGEKVSWTTNTKSLTINRNYSSVVSVTDDLSLEGTSDPTYYNTTWAEPAVGVLTVSTVNYNVEGKGYISVLWDDSSRDPNFLYYILEKSTDSGEWIVVNSIYERISFYEHRDYDLASGAVGTYRLTQYVDTLGETVKSQPSPSVSGSAVTDGYWILTPFATEGSQLTAFKLSIVTSDAYTEEYEKAEFNLIGRGRHVDEGDRFGYRGSLTAQLRDSEYATAREKKVKIEEKKALGGLTYMRNPFGDVFEVYIDDIQVSRIAGVGVSEFVDVTIPYIEVGR